MMAARISERDVSAAFESALVSGAWAERFPRFERVKRELDCMQGRPDYVGATKYSVGEASIVARSSQLAGVLSLLKRRAVRSEGYVSSRTGQTPAAIRRMLRELLKHELVEEVSPGRWRLGPSEAELNAGEVWAFEVKVHDWGRALFQAGQYRAFADRIVVVLPVARAGSAKRWIQRFEKSGVGVVLIEPPSGKMIVLVKPRKVRPISRIHRYVAVARLCEDGGAVVLPVG